jgi:hypothetical protein
LASFVIQSVNQGKFVLRSTSDGKFYHVNVIDHGDGKAELEGLPNKLGAFLLSNFTDKEILEDTTDVINVLITMYDSKGNG